MSQWTKSMWVGDALLVAHVDCPPFQHAQAQDKIDMVMLIATKQWSDVEESRATAKRVEQEFVGRTYQEWVEASDER